MSCTCQPFSHKHAEVIKAWADGAIIQYKAHGATGGWHDCEENKPNWLDDYCYRVKPAPVIRRSQAVGYAQFEADDTHYGVSVTLAIERTNGMVTNVTLKGWN